ncbi:hypothetical protein ANCDUO_22952 [Ancylostoma duodenale]|uniref:Uncharacterized protein n=1 Tax=Ancylostoma duodenale TaxID=51022 RepID=A0A0C2BSZ5_9BILA|nr:hypothetical protein ANCDUO_22952 [Ancylostoma duodenale]
MSSERCELHCITLDQHAISRVNNKRGFNETMVLVKGFLWVYDVNPTLQAVRNPESSFAFSTPDTLEGPIYGLVPSKVQRRNQTTHLKIAFEGAPDAVVVTAKLCDFSLEDIKVTDFVCATSGHNVSCAIRVCERPSSEQARNHLCREVKSFLSMHSDGSIMRFACFHQHKTTFND